MISSFASLGDENPLRLIARLDIKGDNLVKGLQFDGLRVVGRPGDAAGTYYRDGIDELLLIDVVASLYGRNQLPELVRKISLSARIPVTVGGGIQNVEDARTLILAGADRIAVNSAALRRPALISELANEFGSQAVVVSVQAKSRAADAWEPLLEAGRETSGLHLSEWVSDAQSRGAGELLVTSVDSDGLRQGFDLNLASHVATSARVPVVFSGGYSSAGDIVDLLKVASVSGVAIASELHYANVTVRELKKDLEEAGLFVRTEPGEHES